MGVASSPSALAERARHHARAARASLARFARPAGFRAPPPDDDAAALRLARNLRAFRLHYGALLWAALLLTLLLSRRSPTALFLMAMSKVLASYLLLLRTFPSSWLLHRALDKRLVLSLLLILVVVELAVTDSLGYLFMAIGMGAPLVVLHAVFRAAEDGEGAAKAEGEGEEGGGGGVTV